MEVFRITTKPIPLRFLFPDCVGTGVFPEHKQLGQFLGIKRRGSNGGFLAPDRFGGDGEGCHSSAAISGSRRS